MSNVFLVICHSVSEGGKEHLSQKLNKLAKYLSYPLLQEQQILMKADDRHAFYLTSDNSGIHVHDMSVCCGLLTEAPNNWWEREEMPASSSFMMSTNENNCTLMANQVASRSVWYYFDEQHFIVSTSQRAIVSWLGSFESNAQAISWMLSTGNLGPGNSWDSRIKHLGAAQIIKLDKNGWKLEVKVRSTPEKNIPELSPNEQREQLNELMERVFSDVRKVNSLPKSILTLSGGYDSRVVLYYLVKFGQKVPTATWGLSSAANEVDTDSHIAGLIAAKLNVNHRYFATDFKEPSFEPLLDNFLKLAEGRLDHINSFMDGFQMWQQLYKEGFRNVIRADEVFGWLPSRTEQDVRISLDYHLMEDNANMKPLREFDLEPQFYPEEFNQYPEESLETWRDRLYREFRLPYVLTALHDLVQPYMEVINPLLHDDLITFSKQLPDQSRTNKNIYSRHVASLIPDIPIARKASIPEASSILKSARIVGLMLDELSSQDCRNLLGSKFINWNQQNLKVNDSLVNVTNTGYALWLKAYVPWQLKKLLRRDLFKYKADFNQLAFRAVIATRMQRMLKEDASLFQVNTTVIN